MTVQASNCFVLSAHGVTVTGSAHEIPAVDEASLASIAGFLDIYRRLTLRVLDGFSIESYEKKRQELSFTDAWCGCWAMGISG